MTEIEGVAVCLNGKRVADHDDDQNKDKAVLRPDAAQGYAGAFFLILHDAASCVVSMALVE